MMTMLSFFCVLYRKESGDKQYCNTVNNLISLNTVSQNDDQNENCIGQS